MRGHIRHRGYVAGVRIPLILDTADGFVGADVNICGILRELPVFLRGHVREMLVFRRRRNIDRAVFFRFLDRLLGPLSGVDIIGHRSAAEKIHRHDGIFANRPALQEQNPVAGGDRQQCAQIGLSLVGDADEFLAAMTHFHHRHAATVPIQHFGGGLA